MSSIHQHTWHAAHVKLNNNFTIIKQWCGFVLNSKRNALFAKDHSKYKIGVGQVNRIYDDLCYIQKCLRSTVYFNSGENIGSREGHGTRLKARNEKHEHFLQILLNSAYSRRRKFTGCRYCYWTADECHDQSWTKRTSYWKIECWTTASTRSTCL